MSSLYIETFPTPPALEMKTLVPPLQVSSLMHRGVDISHTDRVSKEAPAYPQPRGSRKGRVFVRPPPPSCLSWPEVAPRAGARAGTEAAQWPRRTSVPGVLRSGPAFSAVLPGSRTAPCVRSPSPLPAAPAAVRPPRWGLCSGSHTPRPVYASAPGCGEHVAETRERDSPSLRLRGGRMVVMTVRP